MRIGLFTPPDKVGQAPIETLIQQVVQAESDGFSSFWFVQLASTGNDVLAAIAAAGRQTEHIELGTGVVSIYSRHPLTMAQQAATAQVMTGGRLSLGIGLSHKPVVEDVMGLSYEKPASYMREYLSIIRPLIDQGTVDYKGQIFQVKSILKVPGSSPIPILIAALAPQMLRLAGEMADGTITWMVGRKALETHITPRINAAAEAAGKPRPRICVALPIAITDDKEAARQYASDVYGRYGQLANYRRVLDIEGVAGPADVVVIGSELEVEEELNALSNAGATDFLAAIFPVGESAVDSEARTRSFLREMNS